MANYNRIIILGNLTRDPEYKQLPSGQPVTRLGIASNRQYKNRQTGAMVQEVCFVDIDVFGPQAESCRQYLQKGRPILVEGRLKFDSWQTPEGQTRSKHSIVADRVVFLGSSTTTHSELDIESHLESSSADSSDPNFLATQEKLEKMSSKKKAGAYATKLSEHEEKTVAEDTPLAGGELDFKDEPPFNDLPF